VVAAAAAPSPPIAAAIRANMRLANRNQRDHAQPSAPPRTK
jgi:hypothetical protein